MADNAIKLTGFNQLSNTFKQVKSNVQDRALVRMVASGANVVKQTARKIVQSKHIIKSGALLNNIVLKREHDVPSGVVQYNVGVRHGPRGGKVKVVGVNKSGGVKVSYQDDPYYWGWVELGHKNVGRDTGAIGTGTTAFTTTLRNGEKRQRTKTYRKSGLKARRLASTSSTPPHPFLQPAFEQRQQDILNAMQKSLSASLVNLV